MHLCISVYGYAAFIASLKPESPSTEAIKISLTPLFLISFITDSQNLADSFSPIYIPKISLTPSRSTPRIVYAALDINPSFRSYLVMYGVHKYNGIYFFK